VNCHCAQKRMNFELGLRIQHQILGTNSPDGRTDGKIAFQDEGNGYSNSE
jgi:hypothetical protein